MELLIASNNQNKLRELKALLCGRFEVFSLAEKGIISEPEETGTTFAENAAIKATAAMRASGLPAIADDSGIAVDALGDAPGVYSARYCGVHADDAGNNALLLKNMQGEQNRKAKFVCAIALVYPDGRTVSAQGECEGILLEEPRGSNGFGYDPLFYLPQYGKTMAEIPAALKNRISHRAAALQNFMKLLDRK